MFAFVLFWLFFWQWKKKMHGVLLFASDPEEIELNCSIMHAAERKCWRWLHVSSFRSHKGQASRYIASITFSAFAKRSMKSWEESCAKRIVRLTQASFQIFRPEKLRSYLRTWHFQSLQFSLPHHRKIFTTLISSESEINKNSLTSLDESIHHEAVEITRMQPKFSSETIF